MAASGPECSAAEVAFYREHGWLVLEDVIARDDLAELVPDYFLIDTDLIARIEAKLPKAA